MPARDVELLLDEAAEWVCDDRAASGQSLTRIE